MPGKPDPSATPDSLEVVARAVWEGSFDVMGVMVRAYVLEDGRRILNAEDVARLLSDEDREPSQSGDGMLGMAAFCRGDALDTYRASKGADR